MCNCEMLFQKVNCDLSDVSKIQKKMVGIILNVDARVVGVFSSVSRK